MITGKFKEADRDRIIAELERVDDIRLKPIGRHRKYLQTAENARFLVLGGQDWHGIPGAIIEAEEAAVEKCTIVIGQIDGDRLRIFESPFDPLLNVLKARSPTASGQYEFNLEFRRGSLRVKEAPDVVFGLLADLPYSDEDRAASEKIRDTKKQIAGMSPEEKEEMLRSLSGDKD